MLMTSERTRERKKKKTIIPLDKSPFPNIPLFAKDWENLMKKKEKEKKSMKKETS